VAQNGTGTLNPKQRRLVASLMGAPSVRAAASEAGVSERTAWRWLGADAVRRELTRRQDAILVELASSLVADASEAREVLATIMRDASVSAGIRVRAACAIQDAALRFAELWTLSERLARVEAAVLR